MSDKSLHQYYLGLMPNLLVEVFFFIPEAEIRKDLLDKLDYFKKNNMLNKIYVFDYYQGPIEYEKGRNNTYAFLKSGKLEENIFSLIEKKSNTPEESFQYVLDNYFELVECFYQIVAWMNNKLIDCVNVDDTVIGLFYLQFNNFKKHLETLEKHFKQKKQANLKSNSQVYKIMDSHFPDLSKSIEQNIPPETISKGVGGVKSTKKPKKKIITELEAEKVLLKTFFNVSN